MAIQQDGGPAPYAPPSAVLTVVDAFRERGLQTPFTTDVLVRAGVTEALANRTFAALQILDFVDEKGDPTDVLNALRLAPTDEFSDRLAEHIRSAYAPIFAFSDPAEDSPQRVRDAFRGYQPIGQQQRMVTLFLGLCERAGIIEPTPKRQAVSGSTPRARVVAQPRKQPKPSRKPAGETGDAPHEHDEGRIPGPLLALMRLLPTEGHWTAADRKRWLDLFEITLNYLIVVVEPTEKED